MERQKKFEKMDHHMLVSMLMEKNKGMVYLNGMMVQYMKAISFRIIYMVKGNIFGLMAGNIMVLGKKIKCLIMENLFGQMEEFIKEIMLMIKNMVMENFFGQMEGVLKVHG